jgi:hypothetical protein
MSTLKKPKRVVVSGSRVTAKGNLDVAGQFTTKVTGIPKRPSVTEDLEEQRNYKNDVYSIAFRYGGVIKENNEGVLERESRYLKSGEDLSVKKRFSDFYHGLTEDAASTICLTVAALQYGIDLDASSDPAAHNASKFVGTGADNEDYDFLYAEVVTGDGQHWNLACKMPDDEVESESRLGPFNRLIKKLSEPEPDLTDTVYDCLERNIRIYFAGSRSWNAPPRSIPSADEVVEVLDSTPVDPSGTFTDIELKSEALWQYRDLRDNLTHERALQFAIERITPDDDTVIAFQKWKGAGLSRSSAIQKAFENSGR